MAKQNIYDNPEFFKQYAALRRTESGLNRALEQPAFRSLLPPLEGLRIVDLGCGFGHFARHAMSNGAAEVAAVDISRRMLDIAKEETDDPRIRFVNAAVEDYEHADAAADLVVSSLTLHYVRDYRDVVAKIADWLVEDGMFVFSVEHPICTSRPEGWHTDAAGRKLFWPVDRYRDEGRRDSRWFIDGVIKYHRTVETYVNTLLERGFAIRRVLEPEPVRESLAERPELTDERRRPPFLLVSARRTCKRRA